MPRAPSPRRSSISTWVRTRRSGRTTSWTASSCRWRNETCSFRLCISCWFDNDSGVETPSEQTGLIPGNRVVHQQCLACGHAWVAYEGERATCLLCASDKISPPVSLSRIREVLEEAQKKVAAGTLPADEFEDRKTRLAERYQK